MFLRLGRFVHRRHRAVLVVTLLLVALATVWGSGVFPAMSTAGYADPNIEAEQASDLIEREFGNSGVDAVAVYVDESAELSVDDAAFADAVTAVVDRLPSDHVAEVTSYWTPGLGEAERELLVSHDRHATYVALTMVGGSEQDRLADYEAILDDLRHGFQGDPQDGDRAAGLAVHMGGELTSLHQLQEIAAQDLATAQLVAMPVLFLLLLLIFRSAVAAVVPLVLGVLAVLGAMALLRALTYVTEVSIFAMQITVLLGLGLAIDYGLFLVSRFRDELARRGEVATALPETLATAGRTVAFSGLTVVAALCGLLLFPQPASHSFGLGGIAVVLFNIVAAVVVLPAVLALLGPRINALALPWARRSLEEHGATSNTGFWARTATVIMRRPIVAVAASGLVLLVAAAPLLSVQPGLTNHRYLPADNDGQISAELLDEEFPAGGPADTALDIAVVGTFDTVALDGYVRRLSDLAGATGADVEQVSGNVAHLTVGYAGAPDVPANLDLVRDIRAEEWPDRAEEVLVGGAGGPAMSLDNNESTLRALPLAFLFVVAVTLVLLFLAFRSVLLPLKAVLVAVLSLAATLGIVTWGIQEGAFAPVLGFVPVGTTDIWTYGLILVIAFGLITDYELFIVSRAREEYLASGDNTSAVAVALQRTGRIVTSAALLIVVVVGTTGVTSNSLFITTIGIGLTVAVLLDATVVRASLVPASMRLFGDLNWWVPRALRGLLDRVSGEHHHRTMAPTGGDPGGEDEAAAAVPHAGPDAAARAR